MKESNCNFLIGDIINIVPYWKNIWNNGIEKENIDKLLELFEINKETLNFYEKGGKVTFVVI